MSRKKHQTRNYESLARSLEERIKELRCLYAIAEVAEKHLLSVDSFLKEVVEILPKSWQYPEITCARIQLHRKVYRSKNFSASKWCQHAPIALSGLRIGVVEVHYLEEKPAAFEGPFLSEERELIDQVAKRIGETVTRIWAEEKLRETNKALEKERAALKDANAALRGVLQSIHEEREAIKRDVEMNVQTLLIPILDDMELEAGIPCKRHIKLLRKNLETIASPFSNGLKKKHASLSPTEIQICNMIKSGLRTKDIATLRKISTATVHRHRERIRKKLGITNAGVNLSAYLENELTHKTRR